MSRVSDARAQLDAWEAKRPGDYTSQYKDKIDGVMGKLDGMKDFSYDPTRDAAYEQYKNSYTRQAKLANENAQANASAISGGYGSSYGTQAGQSAYQNAMAGLSSATNSLYSQALNQYTQKKSDLQNQLSGYQQAEAQDYEKYQTNYQNWENQRNYYQNAYNQAASEAQAKKNRRSGFWNTVVSVGATLLRPARKRLSGGRKPLTVSVRLRRSKNGAPLSRGAFLKGSLMQDGAFPSRRPEERRRS